MIITKKLFKSGNSLVAVIGKEILNGLNVEAGDSIAMDIRSIKVIKNPIKNPIKNSKTKLGRIKKQK